MTRTPKQKRVLAITINSDIIATDSAIAYTPASKGAPARYDHTIISETVKPFAPRNEASMEHFLENAVIALDEVLLGVHAHMDRPDALVLILGAPWVVAQTRHIAYQSDRPFVLSRTFLETLIKKEVGQVIANELGAFEAMKSKGQIIEKQITHIKLNGYETAKPFGQRAQTLDVALTIAVSPSAVVDRFKQTFKRYFGDQEPTYASEVSADLVAIRDTILAKTASSDALLVTITKATTDIAFMKDNALTYHRTIESGTNALGQTLAKAIHGTPDEAAHLLETYKRKTLAASQEKIAQAAIAESLAAWTGEIEKVFDTHAYGLCAPKTIILIAPPDVSSLYNRTLSENQFLRHACATTDITVIAPAASDIVPGASATTNIHSALASQFARHIVY